MFFVFKLRSRFIKLIPFNWNNTGIYNITVQDSANPLWNNLVESADPLELGSNETIWINATDISGINLVYLEIGGSNESMTQGAGDTWYYSLWQPSTTGVKAYTIWINDNEGNWNSTSGDITVQDTTNPLWCNLVESADPLELGSNETIWINATDLSGINLVYLEIGGSNESMTQGSGDIWYYSLWQPSTIGVKNYTIYMEHVFSNWNNTGLQNFTVQDTIAPLWDSLVESDDPLLLGNNETITIDITDLSGIALVYLEFDCSNHSMSNVGGDTWSYSIWQPSSEGVYNYTVYMKDNSDNWNQTGLYNITVQILIDNISPYWISLIEITDPVELNTTIIILITVTDASGVNQVLFDVAGENHT